MPEWTKKEERQYEHIKESQKERGTGENRAREIAGRTVNKQRREKGKTPGKKTQGTGNPNVSLEDRSVDELQNKAKELDIKGRSKMKKSDLVNAIRENE